MRRILNYLRILLPITALGVITFECATGVFDEEGVSDWIIAIPAFVAITVWLRDDIRDVFPAAYFFLVKVWLRVRNAEAEVELHTRVSIELAESEAAPDWDKLQSLVEGRMRELAPKAPPELLKETGRKRLYRVKGVGVLILERFDQRDGVRPQLSLSFEDMHLTYQKASRTLTRFVTPLLTFLIGLPTIDGNSFGFDVNLDLGREHPFLRLLKHHWSPALKEAITLDVEIRGEKNVVHITDKHVVMRGVGQEVVVATLRKLLALDLSTKGTIDGT